MQTISGTAIIEDDTPARSCVRVRKEAADSRFAEEEQRGALGWQEGRGNRRPFGCSAFPGRPGCLLQLGLDRYHGNER